MNPQSSTNSTHSQGGFTLVITLLILSIVTVLVIGLFGLADGEKSTAYSFDAIEQADLAIKAGLAQASAVLDEVTRTEDAVIFAKPLPREQSDLYGSIPREMLIAARFNPVLSLWEYYPMASGIQRPLDTAQLTVDTDGDGGSDAAVPANEPTEEEVHAIEQVPVDPISSQRPVMYWENLVDVSYPGDGTLKARYCYSVEDLQGKVSLERAGNLNGIVGTETPNTPPPPRVHERSKLLVTATSTNHIVPGLNLLNEGEPLLNEVALYSILEPYTLADSAIITADNRLIQARNALISPWSWKQILALADNTSNWPGVNPETYFERDSNTKRFYYDGPRRIEEGTATGIRSYLELALVPRYSDGSFANAGGKKMNLNRMMAYIEEAENADERDERAKKTVVDIATFIQDHLPEFASGRIGLGVEATFRGFSMGGEEEEVDENLDGLADPPSEDPTDEEKEFAYLKALAAGMIDYADTDSIPNLRLGHYRGIDVHPLVTEQWQKYQAIGSGVDPQMGRYIDYEISHFAELWNPTNHPLSGEVKYAFECNGELKTTVESFDIQTLLREKGDYSPLFEAKILSSVGRPVNEADIEGQYDWWHPSLPLETMKPNEYRVIKFGSVLFRLRDSDSGTTHDVKCELLGYQNAQSDLSSRFRLKFMPSGVSEFYLVDQSRLPIERYTRTVTDRNGARKRFNLGLPGQSYGLENSNFRNNVGDARASFYINAHPDVVNYENGSSPWGRNIRSNVSGTIYGENRIHLWPDGGHSTSQTGISGPSAIGRDRNGEFNDPDLAHVATKPATQPDKFVQYISNKGMFYSVTELGHVFDPLMWAPYATSPTVTSGRLPDPEYQKFADIKPGSSSPSESFCGGNTLRIGRPEHTRFRPEYSANPGQGRVTNRRYSATALLDLFHAGVPLSKDQAQRAGEFIMIDGHVNVNTASRDALRALVAGKMVSDPNTIPSEVHAPTAVGTGADVAGLLADQIIAKRPYISVSELPEKVTIPGAVPTAPESPILGATQRPSDRTVNPEWTDSAAEETFARIYNSGTVRSRNFRVIVTGQAVKTTPSGDTTVLATRSKVFHVYVRPVRRSITTQAVEEQEVEITYARSF